MDRCPLEICGEIYAFACMDDGSTGRSLSLVSRSINATSRPYKFQSVVVVGHNQLIAFAELIENTPLQLRRVECVFLSAHSRHTASDPKGLSSEYIQRKASYAAVERILKAITSCVKVIHAFFIFNRPFILLPISLPALEELMLHGPLETSAYLDQNIRFKSLKHLNLTSSCSPSFLFNNVLTMTPFLTHVYISASDRSDSMAAEWSSILANQLSPFPTHLEKIFIHTPTRPPAAFYQSVPLYDHIMLTLRYLADVEPRVVLLPTLRLDVFNMISIQEAVARWSASVVGTPW